MTDHLMDDMKNIVLEAAQLFHNIPQEDIEVEIKSKNSLVTQVDKSIEEKLVQDLSLLIPESGFIAEEGTSDKTGSKYNWIIDPLDGTTNFIHGVPHFCISLALKDGNEITHGIIYEFNQKEMYWAERSSGSFLNDKVIHCSTAKNLESSLLATGFPYYSFDEMDHYLYLLKTFMKETRGIRRIGSAAYDLACVARGIFDGFFEYSLHPWDVAAGVLLVKESGGIITDFSGGNDYLFGKQIIATNGQIHQEMLEIIQREHR